MGDRSCWRRRRWVRKKRRLRCWGGSFWTRNRRMHWLWRKVVSRSIQLEKIRGIGLSCRLCQGLESCKFNKGSGLKKVETGRPFRGNNPKHKHLSSQRQAQSKIRMTLKISLCNSLRAKIYSIKELHGTKYSNRFRWHQKGNWRGDALLKMCKWRLNWIVTILSQNRLLSVMKLETGK